MLQEREQHCQANFHDHEEIQKNRQCKLVWFLLIAVLLSLICFFFKLPFPIEMKVSCSGGGMLQYVVKATVEPSEGECFERYLQHYRIS